MADDDDANARAIDIHSLIAESSLHTAPSIPVSRASANCCCGNQACAYLKHNQTTLDGLERDVCTAARLGKALLMRHEAYIADSEKERKAMSEHIDTLETEKRDLEAKNATAIEENRSLLDQLENLNSAVAESDTQVTNLQATLRATQQELSRLGSLASRTEKLEQQLAEFEREQVSWHSTLEEKESAEKSALNRWQQAERTLCDLQDQIERIEKEAQDEKERHTEVIGRMERRRAVERELDSAAGRLKGAAALKNGGTESGGPNVVSHFVKDILQDNANLQMGIVELRDMLHTSNEEVEILRQQLSVHQPVVTEETIEQPTPTPAARPHLKEEMRRATTASELHVHHHYHAPPSAPKAGLKRTKKKRYGALTPGHFTPPSGASTPRHSYSPITPSAASAILSHTAASLPESGSNRFSIQSTQTYNSMLEFSGPSSPMSSTHRSSSLFDRVFSDAGQDSSRPTTPDTEDLGSPIWSAGHVKRASKASYHSHQPSTSSHRNRPSLDSILDMSTENLRQFEQQQTSEAVIPEEDEQQWENASSSPNDHEDSSATSPLSEEPESAYQKRPPGPLRRATSHESILSFSGMDVHTLRSRPSQLLTPYGRSFTPQAALSSATAVASQPAAMSRLSNSGAASMLSGMAPSQRQPASVPKQGLGRKVGGWVFGRWGASPTPSTTVDPDTTPTAPKMNRTTSMASGSTGASASAASEDSHASATPKKPKLRPPGINQSGPILGFAPEMKLNHPPIVKTLDQDALKKALGG